VSDFDGFVFSPCPACGAVFAELLEDESGKEDMVRCIYCNEEWVPCDKPYGSKKDSPPPPRSIG